MTCHGNLNTIWHDGFIQITIIDIKTYTQTNIHTYIHFYFINALNATNIQTNISLEIYIFFCFEFKRINFGKYFEEINELEHLSTMG